MATLEAFLSHFHHVRPHGPDRWTAQCPAPAHEDRSHDTLSLGVGRGGRWLVYCWAGCAIAEVLRAAGLRLRDCFADDTSRPWRADTPRTRRMLAERVESARQERRSGAAADRYAAAELIRGLTLVATRLRAWASTLDPEADATWRLLELAATLERESLAREAETAP